MSRLRFPFALAVALVCLGPATASAATTHELAIDESVSRACQSSLLASGTAGATRVAYTAPQRGIITARLAGPLRRGDWDLAAFGLPGGEPLGASTSFGSNEVETLLVEAGDRVAIQACRRSGDVAEAPLALELTALAPVPEVEERISLETVAINDPGDIERLYELGFDVTHDVTPTSATIAAYSDAQRALLASQGFATATLEPDLVATDAADRRSEQRAGERAGLSSLPSGREEYRVYEDYTTEMKALVEGNPGLVREVIVGTTLEGRTIEGVEIAADVESETDGRPVYVNMGGHHAREWQSSEFPIEFALDLVDGFGQDPRITDLLTDVRVIVIPVVNVDGFIASRSYGTSPLDESSTATLALSVGNAAAYIRKNCRPTGPPGEALIPCAQRVASGVDLNRNYGAFWGGVGSSSDTTTQSYRGTAPFSEPESEAIHQLSSGIHDTVLITNHSFTTDGQWLRQPGFRAFGDTTPDEAAMKELGDDMADVTGWTSKLAWTLGEITGATEDWNYFVQGTYGYTPEARAVNFHPNYADAVVTEYEGDAAHAGLGVREAFLIGGERAGRTADHGVIAGNGPPGAELRLTKQLETPTSQEGLVVHEQLDTQLKVPASGSYEWHVNPSSRPLVPGEEWTMTCQRPGGELFETTVAVDRGEKVTVNWAGSCGTDPPDPIPEPEPEPEPEPGPGPGPDPAGPAPKCRGHAATIVGTRGDDRGPTALVGTPGRDVVVARAGDDEIRTGRGSDLICAGVGDDDVRAGRQADAIYGGPGADRLRGLRGPDRLFGVRGNDLLAGGRGNDLCRGGPGSDTRRSCES